MNQPFAMDPPQVIENRLPANVEAEAALLGGMMTANSTIDRVADLLKPEHFFEPLHARIFSAIVKEHSQGKITNPVTLKTYFDADEGMKELGGVGYLAQLTGSGAAVVGVFDFAQQVFDLAQRRMLIGQLQKALSDAHDTSEDVGTAAILADLELAISEATKSNADGATEMSGEACIEAARREIDNPETGIRSGITPVDDAIGPCFRKDLAILAARPAMGKTTTAISYSVGAARRGHGVLFISLEMSAAQIGQKIACDLAFDNPSCRIDYGRLVNGNVNEAERRALAAVQLEMRELPFQVIDAAGPTVQSVARMVRRWKKRFEARGQSLDLVVVDYLQKLRAHGLSSRYEVITEVSQSLKEIAKENDLAVMALSQLSRAVEARDDKRPHLADLRESGQIEQDADVICFLYRAQYYLEKARPLKEEDFVDWKIALEAVEGEIDFICAKLRKGKETTTKGRFFGTYQAIRGLHE